MRKPISKRVVQCLALLIGVLFQSFSATAQTAVSLPDRALDGLVRWALDKGPEDVILDTDMADLGAYSPR